MPNSVVNPIDVATDINVALREFKREHEIYDDYDEKKTREETWEKSVVVPTIINSGTATNVIPSHSIQWYGVRNFLIQKRREEWNNSLCQVVKDVSGKSSENIGDVSGGGGGGNNKLAVDVEVIKGHPATINNSGVVTSVVKKLNQVAPHAGLIIDDKTPPVLAGEDFSHFLNSRPGSFWLLGAGNADGSSGNHHSPSFMPDEKCCWRGVLFWLTLVYLDEHGSGNENEEQEKKEDKEEGVEEGSSNNNNNNKRLKT
jgi:metal-dependent amidase/aminoacylase/carboxypeptidase family protein